MPSVYIKTYGCQMNERDSEQVARSLRERGYELVSEAEDADVILLNTCSVRDMAEQKALGKMGMLAKLRQKRPHLVFGYLGCMAQCRGSELLEQSPHVSLVVGTQKFHRVADHVEALLQARGEEGMDDLRRAIVDTEAEEGSQNTIRDHDDRSRSPSAFVSIMQGCNMRCAFCIVPSTRGAERSRPIAQIVSEVGELVAQGVREVTLLGQIVNLYGRQELARVEGRSPFVQLLEAVCAVPGIERVRFTSPHPIGFRADLVGAFARLSKLAGHVHLPLQSGSDRILKAMRRGYTAARFRHLVAELRAARPGIAITTDIIVGFPGESREDFLLTAALAREVGFDNAFVFRYSPRRDTPAATMEGQVPEEEKERRNHELLEIVNESSAAKLEELVGRQVEVLCEGPSKTNPDRLMGRTGGNKIAVFEGNPRLIGALLPVKVLRASATTLYADALLAA
jgi:tRNA-2-methylthio-N6-dimethylallyladenosine synthase